MALKADPPDFIDSGSYSVSNVSGWATKGLALALGIAVFLPFIMVGVAQGRNLSDMLGSLTGIDTGSNEQGIEVV